MSMAIYDNIHRYMVRVICEQPLHIGSSDGDKEDILRHPTTGHPFVQASGIAGVLADYVQKAYGEEMRERLFGVAKKRDKKVRDENKRGVKANEKINLDVIDERSKVVVLDGRFVLDTVKLEMRTRCSLNGATGSVNAKQVLGNEVVSGQLTTAEYIGTGAEFDFVVLVYGNEKEDDYKIVEDAFAAMNAGKIRFGGQNTTGFGRVSISEIRVNFYDMTDKSQREKWAELTDMYMPDGEIKTDYIKNLVEKLKDKDYCITFKAVLNTALLIKANMIDEERIAKSLGRIEKMPDFMNIINAKKEYIIPGTSLKGIFRSRIETIGEYLALPQEQIAEVFEQRSKILFEDAVIQKERSFEKKRIHLNKISGSTKYKALFSECVTGGEAEVTIHVDAARLEESSEAVLTPKACVALLLYVIRDLAVGAVSLGSGASIGRGLINVDSVSIQKGSEKKAEFSMEEKQAVKDSFVAECLKELERISFAENSGEA